MEIKEVMDRKRRFRDLHERLHYTAAQTAAVIGRVEGTVYQYLSHVPTSLAPTDRAISKVETEFRSRSRDQLATLVRQMQEEGVPISIGLAA